MLFLEEQGYSYDLEELGRYWRAYDRLMAHWAAALPPGRVLEVLYEALVADQEGWTRRLLAPLSPRLGRGLPALLRLRNGGALGQLRPGARADLHEFDWAMQKPFGEKLKLCSWLWARHPEAPAQAGGA